MEKPQPQIICAQEALDLLNCVADSNFDQEKCIRLLNSLRNCILQKKVKKFVLDETNRTEADSTIKEKQ